MTKIGEKVSAVEAHVEGAPRLAASSYLNTAPLIWSFLRGTKRREVELITDTAPARCADMLARGVVDAALVPVIEYQRIPELAVVPQVCVGSRSRVRSVVLVVREEFDKLRDVRAVSLDVSSRTSAALVRLIFREFVGHEPLWTESEPDLSQMLERADAALIIGDPGMTFPREGVVVYDLAELWREQTGLGFVFAMWMTDERGARKAQSVDFAGARDEGLAHVAEIASLYSEKVGLSPLEIREYLLENISFELNEEMRAGLDLFYRLARKHGIIPEIRPLKFVGH